MEGTLPCAIFAQFSQHSSSFPSTIGTSCTFSWESIASQLLRRVLVIWVDTQRPSRPLECCSALKTLRKHTFLSSHGFRFLGHFPLRLVVLLNIMPQMLFGGLFMNLNSVPVGFIWLKTISLFRLGFEALNR